jgi:hypothetical protein
MMPSAAFVPGCEWKRLESSVGKVLPLLGYLCFWTLRFLLWGAKKTSDRIGGLRPVAHPILDAIPFEHEFRRILAGIIVPHNLDEAAVSRVLFFNDYHAVGGFLLGPCPGQSDHQQRTPPSTLKIQQLFYAVILSEAKNLLVYESTPSRFFVAFGSSE